MKPHRVFVGLDPGGKRAFGWCVLVERRSGLEVTTGLRSTAPDVMDCVKGLLGSSVPSAIGIDAPMYWALADQREADKYVRRGLQLARRHTATVSSVNSLRGACLAQGVIVASLCRGQWESCPITEAHPKALLAVNLDAKAFARSQSFDSEHERDAALAAYSARSMILQSPGWRNLKSDEVKCHDLIAFPHPEYWFPTNAAQQTHAARRDT
jgi:hypothetical protein